VGELAQLGQLRPQMTQTAQIDQTTQAPDVRFAPPSIGQAEIDEVLDTLRSGWLSTGPRVHAFERAFAEYVGAKHAIAVNSGTAALHLALLAAQIGPGDEVITTPLTFCATANVVIHAGATPRFADIDPVTWNLSPAAAEDAITARTRAILPVHYAGRPVDVRAFRAIAAWHGSIALIEDAAHAVEAVAAGEKVGATADYSCFSFYATKNLTTGEGGMLTTASDRGAALARMAALHGMTRNAWDRYAPGGTPHYDVVMPGYKYNMMDVQAAIGLHQLAKINEHLAHRESLWHLYDEGLADLPLVLPAPVDAGDVHARHLYTVLVDADAPLTRDELIAALARERISASVHFRAVHLHSYYAKAFGFTRGMFPYAEAVSDRVMSLPLSSGTTLADVHRVIEVLRGLLITGSR
jgi:dTDP-4-amino-4,6-dideoxygalactose transaminase